MPKKAPKKGGVRTRSTGSSAPKRQRPRITYEQPQADNPISEPAVEYTTRIRAIGNSRGLIINNQSMDIAGLDADRDIVIRAKKGLITIEQPQKPAVNTDLSTWEKHLKAAIKAGAKPEGDFFEGMENEFDKTEW